MVEKKEPLKDIPGFSKGVRPNAAARMVKLARPICPNSKKEMEKTPEGKWVPKVETNPLRQNCQEAGFGWWEQCEARGHDPYYTTRVWYSQEDTEGPDPENPDQIIVLGSKTVKHQTRYPNIAQVAAHTRVNSGRGAQFKMQVHGFKRLADIGYKEVCQFRNCQNVATVRSNFGLYCGQEHALLIAADSQGVLLSQRLDSLQGEEAGKVVQKRSKQLSEAGLFANIRPI